jgi:hypothetical protein
VVKITSAACWFACCKRVPRSEAFLFTGYAEAVALGAGVGRVWFFDIQGWITLILGGLLALITLFTSYSHVHLPFLGSVALNQQVGVLLLLALVPPLFGDAELATRCRLRAERDRVRAARRAQRQAECNLVQLRHQLEPTEANARRVRDVMSLLEEYGGFA